MSEFDDFAAANAGALIEQFGERGSVIIRPTAGEAFTVDAILGLIRGATEFTDVGQEIRLLTATVQVERRHFAEHGITELPATAMVDAYGLEKWSLRLAESEWGQVWVKLGIERTMLAREWQARSNASV